MRLRGPRAASQRHLGLLAAASAGADDDDEGDVRLRCARLLSGDGGPAAASDPEGGGDASADPFDEPVLKIGTHRRCPEAEGDEQESADDFPRIPLRRPFFPKIVESFDSTFLTIC